MSLKYIIHNFIRLGSPKGHNLSLPVYYYAYKILPFYFELHRFYLSHCIFTTHTDRQKKFIAHKNDMFTRSSN